MYEAYRWGEVDELYPHVLPTCLDRCAIAVHDNTFYFMGGKAMAVTLLEDAR